MALKFKPYPVQFWTWDNKNIKKKKNSTYTYKNQTTKLLSYINDKILC